MKNVKDKNMLICKSTKFYCKKDEEAFFECIKKITCIDKISGAGKELYLHLAADELHDNDLRDIIGLFFRYNVDMKQLARFLTDRNRVWFFDKPKGYFRGYWHQRVFGRAKKS
ncbi:MAG TPA: hypothetical protein VGT41_03625 [Candidatus Babeliales bacterium]|nr:hypothetical protein [Candidatus Babeliales bacterium]